MNEYTYFVDGFELLYRVNRNGVAQMWKNATKTWGNELDKVATEAADIERGMPAWTVYTGPMPEGLEIEPRLRHLALMPATTRGVCTLSVKTSKGYRECGEKAVATWGITFGGAVTLVEEGRCIGHWDVA